MTEPTDEAIRAEAEKRWPSYPAVGFSGAEDRQRAFEEGARWAREQTVLTRVGSTVCPVIPDTRGLLEEFAAPTEPPEQVIEAAEKAVLANFHPPDDRHGCWWLNPETVARAVLAVARDAGWQTAPTVAPDAGTLIEALARVPNMPSWWGGTQFRRAAEAVAAADPRRTEAEVKAEAWDEAAQALAWAQENGPDPARYVAEHNPYRDRAARLREGSGQ